ncbi:hypothetical protein [Enterovibrio norvegicus]|uniref:hypothetical protein n=1 Tax=Enterovibrio norvegicus TaxID=188144 RepID=UPI00352F4933
MEDGMQEPIDNFKEAVSLAYQKYQAELEHALCDCDTEEEFKNRSRIAAKRRGSEIVAGKKNAIKEMLIALLVRCKCDGLDITPTVAKYSIKRVLGRSVGARSLQQSFGTPGRTASDKSRVRENDLAEIEKEMKTELICLNQNMDKSLMQANDQWRNTEKAARLIEKIRSNFP